MNLDSVPERVARISDSGGYQSGATLMERALVLPAGHSDCEMTTTSSAEAMDLFRGTTAFFHNETGHRLLADYGREDAVEFVAFLWIFC